MKNSIIRDNRRRQDFYKNMCRLGFYKYIYQNQNLPENIRSFYKNLYAKNFLIKIRIRNRCFVSGRSRGISRFYKISRVLLQEKALSGDINGLSKASW